MNDINTLVERFLSACGEDQTARFGELTAALKQGIKDGQTETVIRALRLAIAPTLDYTAAVALSRIQQRLRGQVSGQKVRLAVLGSFTTTQITQLMELFLFAAGITPEIYEAEFGTFRQEILDPQSKLYEFKPTILFVATSWRDLGHLPNLADSPGQVAQCVNAELAEWTNLWKIANDRLGCQVIQNNFAPPPWRTLANYESAYPAGFARYIAEMNRSFALSAPLYVTVHDTDFLAATAGHRTWGDERFFHHAKMPCAPEYLVDYAHSVASLVAAQLGSTKKCLVLDLDNTLWGGVIGDDGLGGIRLGQGDPEGEAYLSFQRYAKALRQRGVILAVCSKNEEPVAREVFEKHTEMILRPGDISCFVANWKDKAANLRAIASELNIGLNSLVFVDDNRAERAIVRQLLPEVAVPELGEDPASYVDSVERHRYFQVISIGSDDFRRTGFYRDNAQRKELESSVGDIEQFLRSLEMRARIEPVTAITLERTVQLINKSNQFNLTTRRYATAEVLAMLDDAGWLTRTVSLADRFGDNGLISVLLAKQTGESLQIDTWLMSCRVLKRGVEEYLLQHMVAEARRRGLQALRGEYIPTAKNALVRDHYARLGFTPVKADSDGTTHWELPLNSSWQPAITFIKETTTP